MKISIPKGIISATAFAAVVLFLFTVVQRTATFSGELGALRALAESGEADAQNRLGDAYRDGEGVAMDMRESARWYRKAAEQGNALAQSSLGFAYWNGDGVSKDQREAVHWFRKAAEQGEPWAQFSLGDAYRDGVGVAQDKREAMRWWRKAAEQWRKAAEQGDASAQYSLGDAYRDGEGVAQDKREAVRWWRKAAEQWRKAAEQGDALAQSRLGDAYRDGKGVAKDEWEAVHWWRKAAEQGVPWAQFNLGQAYRIGEGTAKDAGESILWYRKAAERGDPWAQSHLGYAYWSGAGVVQDKREAVRWWRKAAEQGDTSAQAWLKSAGAKIFGSSSHGEDASKYNDNFALAPEPKGENPAARVFENTWRSVVVVHSGGNLGSGVIIRPNIVATNCHVVDSRARIVVHKSAARRADTETDFSAEILRADKKKDFCLLQVQNLWGVVATVRKYDTLKIGEKVYALGAPQGLDLSLSEGVISQLRKSRSARLIQTDAAISPGSSGGGLFDRDGNLIGILTSKITGQNTEGLGFAIPADLVLGN